MVTSLTRLLLRNRFVDRLHNTMLLVYVNPRTQKAHRNSEEVEEMCQPWQVKELVKIALI